MIGLEAKTAVSEPLWSTQPDLYERCERCGGSGAVPCRWCSGRGSTVGPDWYASGGRIGRRFGIKRCASCNGRGTHRCWCEAGSVRRPGASLDV